MVIALHPGSIVRFKDRWRSWQWPFVGDLAIMEQLWVKVVFCVSFLLYSQSNLSRLFSSVRHYLRQLRNSISSLRCQNIYWELHQLNFNLYLSSYLHSSGFMRLKNIVRAKISKIFVVLSFVVRRDNSRQFTGDYSLYENKSKTENKIEGPILEKVEFEYIRSRISSVHSTKFPKTLNNLLSIARFYPVGNESHTRIPDKFPNLISSNMKPSTQFYYSRVVEFPLLCLYCKFGYTVYTRFIMKGLNSK